VRRVSVRRFDFDRRRPVGSFLEATAMSIGNICNRHVSVTYRNVALSEAAKTMREDHIGCLIVVDEGDRRRIPLGLLTDRDITITVVARDVDARTLTVEEIMTTNLVTVHEKDGEVEALRTMRRHGIRRLPVVDESGALIGIVTMDDILRFVATELGELAMAIRMEQDREIRKRA
jgi:CBS domain-containing protein